jgi:hypothetical protein
MLINDHHLLIAGYWEVRLSLLNALFMEISNAVRGGRLAT